MATSVLRNRYNLILTSEKQYYSILSFLFLTFHLSRALSRFLALSL